ncbi:MAG: YjbQ family protein [Longimicrobiales bacterium]
MTASRHTVHCHTRGNGDILDLTEDIQRVVAGSGVVTGQATLMVVGSTAALTTLEYEPGLVHHDIVAALERIAPEDGRYRHEETWHDDNGHSHVRAALIGPSLALPHHGRLRAPGDVAAGGPRGPRHPTPESDHCHHGPRNVSRRKRVRHR